MPDNEKPEYAEQLAKSLGIHDPSPEQLIVIGLARSQEGV